MVKRLETLHGCLGVELSALEFNDDWLATGLDRLSNDRNWASFEDALNQPSLHVYN